jgi:hypothetical protein
MAKRVSVLQIDDVSSDSEGPYDPYRPYKSFVPSPEPSPARPPSPDLLALNNKAVLAALREKKEVLALFPSSFDACH